MILSIILGALAIGSAIAVISFRNPLKSVIAMAINLVALTFLFVALGVPMLGLALGSVGLLIMAGLFQFMRAVGKSKTLTPHRFGFGQLIGLLVSFLFGIFVLLQLSILEGGAAPANPAPRGFTLDLASLELWVGVSVCVLLLLTAFWGFRNLMLPSGLEPKQ